jgi:hypothetical protein
VDRKGAQARRKVPALTRCCSARWKTESAGARADAIIELENLPLNLLVRQDAVPLPRLPWSQRYLHKSFRERLEPLQGDVENASTLESQSLQDIRVEAGCEEGLKQRAWVLKRLHCPDQATTFASGCVTTLALLGTSEGLVSTTVSQSATSGPDGHPASLPLCGVAARLRPICTLFSCH